MSSSAVDVLKQVPLFADLDSSDLELLADSMHRRTFRAGETVVAEGVEPDGFYVVESGEAEVLVGGARQRTLERGDCFGETALLMGSGRTATINATSDLNCYAMAPSEFRAIVESSSPLAWKLYQAMARWL